MRNLALNYAARCPRCALPPRWCICAGEQKIASTVSVDLLTHKREVFRSSSSGNLIKRIFSNARQHVWHNDQSPLPSNVLRPAHEVWILHPHGEPLPSTANPASTQVILLDGSWSEVRSIAHSVGSWGRLIQLPMHGPSRFWLRAKQDNERYSTAEALLFLLDALGLQQERDVLRVQFELHVYAHLRARGKPALAEQFLEESVLPHTLPKFLGELRNNQTAPTNSTCNRIDSP
jgi:DTW domain-containing protein